MVITKPENVLPGLNERMLAVAEHYYHFDKYSRGAGSPRQANCNYSK
jgi:hypothetical protein